MGTFSYGCTVESVKKAWYVIDNKEFRKKFGLTQKTRADTDFMISFHENNRPAMKNLLTLCSLKHTARALLKHIQMNLLNC